MTTSDLVREVLQGHASLRHTGDDPELEAVALAILVEDVFGVVLCEDDLRALRTADAARIEALVVGRVGAV